MASHLRLLLVFVIVIRYIYNFIIICILCIARMIIIEYELYRNRRKAVCMARLVVIERRPTGEVAMPPRPARQDSWAFLSLTGPRGVWHFPFRRPQAAHDYCFFGYGLRDQAWVAGCITSAMGVGHPQFLPCGPASSSLLWDCQSICHHCSQKMVKRTLSVQVLVTDVLALHELSENQSEK
jgi:hypothetical protein